MSLTRLCLVALCLSLFALPIVPAFGQADQPAAQPAPPPGATTRPEEAKLPPATQPDPQAVPTSQPEVVDRGAASVKELLENMHKMSATGKTSDMLGFMEPGIRKFMKQSLDLMKQVSDKAAAVAKTVEEKIGKEQAEKLRGMAGGAGMMEETMSSPIEDAVKDGQILWDKIKITQTANKADVQIDGESIGMPIVKVGQKWYISGPEEANPLQMAVMMTMQRQMVRKMVDGLDQIEKKVKSGQITKDNYDQETAKIMGGAMGMGD